ncbi:hypothetical protein AB4Z54_73280, partial [Streptomyces sp. MCAF7]
HIAIPDGRVALHSRIGLLSAFTESKAWREAETELETIASLLPAVTSGRSRHILQGVLQKINKEARVPIGLSILSRETSAALAT